eukprot:3933551-Rhodomonas_salina.1
MGLGASKQEIAKSQEAVKRLTAELQVCSQLSLSRLFVSMLCSPLSHQDFVDLKYRKGSGRKLTCMLDRDVLSAESNCRLAQCKRTRGGSRETAVLGRHP